MEHVKELVQSIKVNGGLRVPVIVRGDMVLEGNSRLAAYRVLCSRDPAQWAEIKCHILREDVGDDIAFAILADHISGKKDWKPYEQAGYLYRRNRIHSVPLEQIASDLAMSLRKLKHLIMVYAFMVDYDEYLKSTKIRKVRDANPGLDDLIVKKIRTGEIPMAVDVRDKLKAILTGEKRIVTKFVSGEKDFSESYELLTSRGGVDGHYKRLKTFRLWIVNDGLGKAVAKQDKAVVEKCRFELTKIQHATERLLKKLPDY
jgi:hypothetical protein